MPMAGPQIRSGGRHLTYSLLPHFVVTAWTLPVIRRVAVGSCPQISLVSTLMSKGIDISLLRPEVEVLPLCRNRPENRDHPFHHGR